MKRLLCLLLILPMLSAPSCAESGSEDIGSILSVGGVEDELSDEVRITAGTLRLDGSYDSAGALERLWNRFCESLSSAVRQSAGEALKLFGMMVVCSACGILMHGTRHEEWMQSACCAGASLLMAGDVNGFVSQSLSVMNDLENYAKAALPAIYTAAAASGAPISASTRYAASCFALDLIMEASSRLILPLIGANIAMSVCGSIYDNPVLRSGVKWSRKLSALTMSGLGLVLTGFLSVTGLVGGSADALAVKTAKTMISGAVPVVGNIVSDAAASVLAAASVVRNSAGVFGLVAVCAICVGPFASLLVKRFFLSLTAAAAEMTVGSRFSRLLGDMASVFGMLLGMTAIFELILFFSIYSAMRTVSG